MDGPSLITFTIGEIPKLVDDILKTADLAMDDLAYLLFHQATFKMLDQLQQALEVDSQKMPIRLERLGNTVSSTIPILINQMRKEGNMTPNMKNLLVGFGVGWSWSGCVWQDVLQERL
jgi:3-oxoacyl-[acyl-carrier-protein] synthase-3